MRHDVPLSGEDEGEWVKQAKHGRSLLNTLRLCTGAALLAILGTICVMEKDMRQKPKGNLAKLEHGRVDCQRYDIIESNTYGVERPRRQVLYRNIDRDRRYGIEEPIEHWEMCGDEDEMVPTYDYRRKVWRILYADEGVIRGLENADYFNGCIHIREAPFFRRTITEDDPQNTEPNKWTVDIQLPFHPSTP